MGARCLAGGAGRRAPTTSRRSWWTSRRHARHERRGVRACGADLFVRARADEAIEKANDSLYGLQASVFSENIHNALRSRTSSTSAAW